MPRKQQLRFFVEVAVEHQRGSTMLVAELEALVGEVIHDAVGVGSVFAAGNGRRAAYKVTEARTAPLDTAATRRLFA